MYSLLSLFLVHQHAIIIISITVVVVVPTAAALCVSCAAVTAVCHFLKCYRFEGRRGIAAAETSES